MRFVLSLVVLAACSGPAKKQPDPPTTTTTRPTTDVAAEPKPDPTPEATPEPKPEPVADKDPAPPRAPVTAKDLEASPKQPAPKESQWQISQRLNDEGKDLFAKQKYNEASSKFREAVARVPEAIYFFNLCLALFQEGRFGEALTACNAVDSNAPSKQLKAKNAKMMARIKDEAKAQGLAIEPTK